MMESAITNAMIVQAKLPKDGIKLISSTVSLLPC
jgi:hypothetical protein